MKQKKEWKLDENIDAKFKQVYWGFLEQKFCNSQEGTHLSICAALTLAWHKHNDIFPSIASRIHAHLFSLFLDVWEVHYHGHPLWQNWETNAFSWSSYPMGQQEQCKYQPVANDQFISSFMGSTLQSVKRFLEVALQLNPGILNFRMNLSIFMNCRIP